MLNDISCVVVLGIVSLSPTYGPKRGMFTSRSKVMLYISIMATVARGALEIA